MRVPLSTYRVQFNQAFRFADGRDLAPYLHELGIGDLYSSPWFKARRGSSHGYDIADPMRINSELGTDEEFEELSEKLRHYGMGLLLDVVPNHMAASSENPWWMDVLENGAASEYAEFFDIDWTPPLPARPRFCKTTVFSCPSSATSTVTCSPTRNWFCASTTLAFSCVISTTGCPWTRKPTGP